MTKRQALTPTMIDLLRKIGSSKPQRINPYASEVGTCRALEVRGYLSFTAAVPFGSGRGYFELTPYGRGWLERNSK